MSNIFYIKNFKDGENANLRLCLTAYIT